MDWNLILLAVTPYMLLVCLLGTTLGILWGAMPGLSTTMAMALLIGLSAGMSQYVALMFMLGVYTGSVFGGAISAVLINIPGTPDAVPTMIEGHPLAKRGEGGLALGTAIAASFLGNWVGILLLIAFIPVILLLALHFKSWEMFLLSMWGIAICGSMTAGERPLKGWISGWIGLLIAFVGLDLIHGVPRYTFGVDILEDGISYIPILIGLFGLTEILRVLPQKAPYSIPAEVGRVVPPFATLWKYSGSAVRSGLIGTVIGAIPGAGANVASFLSYDIGRRRAAPEERKKWGKGSYEAIVCAEVANNANIGGSMLPTLTSLASETPERLGVDREFGGPVFYLPMDYSDRITIEPGKRGGKPCIRGLRITVYDILEYLAAGMSTEEILADFPDLTREDIRACLAFAADRERKFTTVPAS